jgi:hypothetical protein
MEVRLNIRQSANAPAWQKTAWNEFLSMLVEEAEAELKNKKEAGRVSAAPLLEGGDKK